MQEVNGTARLQAFESGESLPFTFQAVHLCIDLQAKQNPSRVALKFRGEALTYADLHRYACCLAERLRVQGVKAGDRVALWMPRSSEALVSILAILRTGAAYVPIDYAFPERRVRTILEDCCPLLVLCHAGDPCKGASQVMEVDFAALDRDGIIESAPAPVSPYDPIYVIYTSGTTGKPKGIVQTHAAIANLIAWQNQASGISFDTAVLQYSSLSFDVHLQELFSTWSNGGCLCVVDEESRLDADSLLSLIRGERVQTLFLSISALQNLFINRQGFRTLPECVRHIITAGEQLYLTTEIIELLRERPTLAIHNHYGVSESHVVTTRTITGRDSTLPRKVPVGAPIANTKIVILDELRRRVPVGEKGEIWIAGVCLAAGYLNRPDLDAEYYHDFEGLRFYKTRDIGAWLPSGDIEFFGRIDTQVKISGSLVEPAEVEAHLLEIPGVQKCAVVAPQGPEGRYLVAYFVADRSIESGEARQALARALPPFMVPLKFVQVPTLPVGATGKIDRDALVAREDVGAPSGGSVSSTMLATSAIETLIAEALSAALHVDVERHAEANFFDLGAGSLQIVNAAALLSRKLGDEVSPLAFYRNPTIGELAGFLSTKSPKRATCGISPRRESAVEYDAVAIVGIAGQFPGADSVAALWELLLKGGDGTSEVLRGANRASWLLPQDSIFGTEVGRAGIIQDAYCFDAKFFGISEGDALWMDPQHRLFLQSAYHALEDAHEVRHRKERRIGVFAGCDVPSYLAHVQPYIESMTSYLRALSLNDKDFLSTRASYELDLRGPSITVQTACSTSLVAVHLAAQSVLSQECDIALAGAVSLGAPQDTSYFFEEGGVYSPDGKMRPFDESGSGIVITNAVAVVCLKSLSSAIRDGNRIYAVIRGSAVNNDGAQKVGYSAPSAQGQRDVVAQALARAKVPPESVAFIETHGTGTKIGDPIEVEGLLESYSAGAPIPRRCALGSIKGNIGHTNRAAGVVGLIKAALSLFHGVFPGTANIQQLNKLLQLEGTSFFVNREPLKLVSSMNGQPVRGAVSSFGLGGTNAHVVLEAHHSERPSQSRVSGAHLIPLSAKSETSLSALRSEVGTLVHSCGCQQDISDLSYSTSCAREEFNLRTFVVGAGREELLQECSKEQVTTSARPGIADQVAFLFPGQTLVERHVFVEALSDVPLFEGELSKLIDEAQTCGFDISFVRNGHTELFASGAGGSLENWHLGVVVIELALARMWQALGVTPQVLVGYSLGEIVAAHVAGGMNLQTLLQLVHARARLLASTTSGGMLAVFVDVESAREFLSSGCEIAIQASRSTTIFAGDEAAIETLKIMLDRKQVGWRATANTRANHSRHMEAVKSEFRRLLDSFNFTPLQKPVCVNTLGSLRRPGEVLGAEHWARHVVEPVLFGSCLQAVQQFGVSTWLELDLTPTLLRFVQQELDVSDSILVPSFNVTESAHALLATIGKLWAFGGAVQLERLFKDSGAGLGPMPRYQFERKEYFLPYNKTEEPVLQSEGSSRTHPVIMEVRETRVRSHPPKDAQPYEEDSSVLVWTAKGLEAVGRRIERSCRERGVTSTLVGTTSSLAEGPFSDPLLSAAPQKGALELVVVEDVESMRGSADERAVGVCFHSYKERILGLLRVGSSSDRVHVRFVFVASHPETPLVAECQAFLRALAITIPQEHVGWEASYLGVTNKNESLADSIVEWLLAWGPETHLLIDHGVALLEVPTRLSPTDRREKLIDGELILVGGTGKFGLDLAYALLAKHELSVTIVGRRAPAELSKQLERFAAFAKRFRYYQADTTSSTELASVLRERHHAKSRILAVLHLAAHIRDEEFLQSLKDISSSDLRAHEAAKIGVLLAIEQACSRERINKKILFSSLSSFLGGVGYFGYTWANAAADLCCRMLPGWTAINWDVVRTISAHGQGMPVSLGSSADHVQLEVADCADRLLQILAAPNGQFIVTRRVLGAFSAERERIRLSLGMNAKNVMAAVNDQAPNSLVESVRSIWKDLLGCAEVSNQSSFASLGGNSLLAVQTILSINRRLGLRIPLSAMMKSRSFGDFVGTVIKLSTLDPEVHEAPSFDSSMATPWEERWNAMAERGFGRLQMPMIVSRRLEPQLVRGALQALSACHEAMRTTFGSHADGLTRRVLPTHTIPMRVTELRDASLESQREAVHQAWKRLNGITFDLTSVPPFYTELLLLDQNTSVLMVVTHHILFDGWSSSIFAEDFEKAYLALERGEKPSLAGTAYSHFADWYARYREGSEYQRSKDYWLSSFEGGRKPTRLATAGLQGREESQMPAERIHFTISAELNRKVRELASRNEMSSFEIFFASYLLTLHALGGEQRLVVGTTDSGRHSSDVSRTMGVFVNPMPLTFQVSPNELVRDFLMSVKSTVEDFKLYQMYPLWTLWKEHSEASKLDPNELFHFYILYQNYYKPELTNPNFLTVLEVDDWQSHPLFSFVEGEKHTLMRDVELIFFEHGETVSGNFWYRSHVLSEASALQHVNCINRILLALVSDETESRVGDIAEFGRKGVSLRQTALSAFSEEIPL